MADVLLKKKFYKEQMDDMLCQYVFPEFTSPRGHMRARVSIRVFYLDIENIIVGISMCVLTHVKLLEFITVFQDVERGEID